MAIRCLDNDFTDDELKRLTQILEVDVTANPATLREAIDAGLQNKARRVIQNKLQVVKNKLNADLIDGSKAKPESALEMMLSVTGHTGDEALGIIPMENRIKVVSMEAHKMASSAFENYRPKMLGLLRSTKGQKNIIRELYGVNTGDGDAAKIAGDLREMFEMLRVRANRAGAGIDKLESWALPQSHDVSRISKAGFEKWFNDTSKLIDRKNTFNKMSEEKFRNVMQGIWKSLASDGTIKIKLTGQHKFLRKVGNRHQEHRLLHFADGDKWIEYNRLYGKSDELLEVVEGYINMMSRDIGAMEALGPDPDGAMRTLRAHVKKRTMNRGAGNLAQNIYDDLMMGDDIVNTSLARIGQGLRTAQNVKLHSAVLSAISDPVFMAITNAYSGLPIMKPMMRMLKNVVGGTKMDRQIAINFISNADLIVNRASSRYRYGELSGFGMWTKAVDAGLRATGLNHWTYSAKHAFGLEFMSFVGTNASKPMKELPKRLQKTFKRYGINEADWDQFKGAVVKREGAVYVDPSALPDQELRIKLAGMIDAESSFAVPESTARVRAMLVGKKTAKGTFWGETKRTALVFKTFPVTIMALHLSRALRSRSNLTKTAYLASLLGGTYAIGLLSSQAVELVNGRERMDWKSPALHLAALKRTAGLDFFGELVMPHTGKFDVPGFIAGPVGADVNKLGTLVMGGSKELLTDNKSIHEAYGPKFSRLLKGYEGITTPWYAKLAMQRALWDNVDRLLDPQWDRKQMNMIKRHRREGKEDYWWSPHSPATRW